MTENEEIKAMFNRMGNDLAHFDPYVKRWSSNSQYGFTLNWFDTKAEAIENTLSYYKERMYLIRQ